MGHVLHVRKLSKRSLNKSIHKIEALGASIGKVRSLRLSYIHASKHGNT